MSFFHLPHSKITIEKSERQRKDLGDVNDLKESIKKIGQLNPVIITKDNVLIAGERRVRACSMLGIDVLCRYLDDLSQEEQQLIELDENIKRKELDWKEEVSAIAKLHSLLSSLNESWFMVNTAEYIGITSSYLSRVLTVNAKLVDKDPRFLQCTGIKQACNILERELNRAMDNELNNFYAAELSDGETESEPKQSVAEALGLDLPSPQPKEEKAKSSILTSIDNRNIFCKDFNEFAKTNSKQRFNLLHCDFPYGINHGESDQGGTKFGRWEGYNDSEDVYWSLCKTLTENIDNILYPSAHIIFWLSMKFFSQTIEYFTNNSDLTIDPYPLIWHKTDGKGIIRDVNRTPRNCYEVALFMSRGDRKIITPVSNIYGGPTTKDLHVSEKPEPMLKHFFRLCVDSYTELLDPTCGSGSAIRAAEAMGAKRAVGFDLNPEFADLAWDATRKSRTLATLSKASSKHDN